MKKIISYVVPYHEKKIEHEVILLIDVLRSTTVISYLFEYGARQVSMVRSVSHAMSMKGENSMVLGERKGLKVKGFDFGNSPYELKVQYEKGFNFAAHDYVITTSNGAKAFSKVYENSDVMATSFQNYLKICQYLETADDIGILCSGTKSSVSTEDLYLAGKIIQNFLKKGHYTLNDDSSICLALAGLTPSQIIEKSSHALTLKKLGFINDLNLCFAEEKFSAVPFSKRGSLTFKCF